MMSNAQGAAYTRAEIKAWNRAQLLAFFSEEGPPDGLLQRHLKDAATETLLQLAVGKLAAEGRLKDE